MNGPNPVAPKSQAIWRSSLDHFPLAFLYSYGAAHPNSAVAPVWNGEV